MLQLCRIFSSCYFSPPPAELSPGLAALTVGCDSGNLGALSRVQLLLLDRVEAEAPPSPFSLEEELSVGQDWSDLRMQYLNSAGEPGARKHAGIKEDIFCLNSSHF